MRSMFLNTLISLAEFAYFTYMLSILSRSVCRHLPGSLLGHGSRAYSERWHLKKYSLAAFAYRAVGVLVV